MNVHLLNTKALVYDLKNEVLYERDLFTYFLGNFIMWNLLYYFAYLSYSEFDWIFVYELVLVLLVIILGLFKCFQANGGDLGSQFVVRATCLSLPIGLKIFVLSISCSYGLFFSFPFIIEKLNFPKNPNELYDIINFMMAVIFTTLYMWRLKYHIELIVK